MGGWLQAGLAEGDHVRSTTATAAPMAAGTAKARLECTVHQGCFNRINARGHQHVIPIYIASPSSCVRVFKVYIDFYIRERETMAEVFDDLSARYTIIIPSVSDIYTRVYGDTTYISSSSPPSA